MKKTNVVAVFAAIAVAAFAESGVEKDSPQDGYSTNMARGLGGIVCWDTHWITNVSVPRLDSMYVELEAETNWTRVYYG